MIQTQTLEFNKNAKDELLVIAAALDLIAHKQYDEAVKVLIRRQDELTANSTLKPYDQRTP